MGDKMKKSDILKQILKYYSMGYRNECITLIKKLNKRDICELILMFMDHSIIKNKRLLVLEIQDLING